MVSSRLPRRGRLSRTPKDQGPTSIRSSTKLDHSFLSLVRWRQLSVRLSASTRSAGVVVTARKSDSSSSSAADATILHERNDKLFTFAVSESRHLMVPAHLRTSLLTNTSSTANYVIDARVCLRFLRDLLQQREGEAWTLIAGCGVDGFGTSVNAWERFFKQTPRTDLILFLGDDYPRCQ